jgi:hypothetical protein
MLLLAALIRVDRLRDDVPTLLLQSTFSVAKGRLEAVSSSAAQPAVEVRNILSETFRALK